MKRLLIISPYFAPSNTPDMQRIRMSLPYFKLYNWEAEVVTVNSTFSDVIKDDLLLKSIPDCIKIHKVNAFSKAITSKFGLGSLALRSMLYYRRYVNRLLSTQKFDLIYFSTTEFPITILGSYWKRKFSIPFVIDFQDPWHSDYYQNIPKKDRPKKYWFSYRLNKYLEPIALKSVDGLISVSEYYLQDLKKRYSNLDQKPLSTITFSAFEKDIEIANEHIKQSSVILSDQINIVYVGRGGNDMEQSLSILFKALKKGLENNFNLFSKLRFYFIGTSYAPSENQQQTILPIAKKYDVSANVIEQTQRIGFYDGLKCLQSANGLLIIGSNDAKYTASKIYPYILAKKPLLAIFKSESSAVKIINKCNAGVVAKLDDEDESLSTVYNYLSRLADGINYASSTNWKEFENYGAQNMTKQQCELFGAVLERYSH